MLTRKDAYLKKKAGLALAAAVTSSPVPSTPSPADIDQVMVEGVEKTGPVGSHSPAARESRSKRRVEELSRTADGSPPPKRTRLTDEGSSQALTVGTPQDTPTVPPSPPHQPSPHVFSTPPPPQFSLLCSLPDVSEGVQRVVTSMDVTTFFQLDDVERLRLLADSFHHVLDGVVNGVLVVSCRVTSGISAEEAASLQAEIQRLEAEASASKKALEEAATREAALKKEAEAAQILMKNLEEAKKSLEGALGETKKAADENNLLVEKVWDLEADVKEYAAPAVMKRKLGVAE